MLPLRLQILSLPACIQHKANSQTSSATLERTMLLQMAWEHPMQHFHLTQGLEALGTCLAA